MDVFRLNTAHGDRHTLQQRLERVRAASGNLGQPVAVLVDLAGPKIRLGKRSAASFNAFKGSGCGSSVVGNR